jgi:hypothetical protein
MEAQLSINEVTKLNVCINCKHKINCDNYTDVQLSNYYEFTICIRCQYFCFSGKFCTNDNITDDEGYDDTKKEINQ